MVLKLKFSKLMKDVFQNTILRLAKTEYAIGR